MKKIPSVFVRDQNTKLVTDVVTTGCEWVVAGEGVATRKWDGTAVMVREGVVHKRYDAKAGKTPPAGFMPCQEPDPVTGHWPGWVPLSGLPVDQWIALAAENYAFALTGSSAAHNIPDGTYEACGPKINNNPERLNEHTLLRHGDVENTDVPRDFAGIRDYLRDRDLEGYVFHHPDGRMAKVKLKDFGHKRGATR